MKQRVVLVNNCGARVFINPSASKIKKLQREGTVLVNPQLNLVKHLSPEFWSLNKINQLVPASNLKRKLAVRNKNILNTANTSTMLKQRTPNRFEINTLFVLYVLIIGYIAYTKKEFILNLF